MSSSRLRVVIAGQVPPPYGGQNIMIQKALTQFAQSSRCQSVHLPFFFTPKVGAARKGSVRKLLELARVIIRLLRIREAGPIDLLLFPTGGPQRIPIIRDILLLPWMLGCARRVVLHFHAAGIADEFARRPGALTNRLLRWLYHRAFGAIVMTDFNRRDPESAGIHRISVVPYRVDDTFVPTLISRGEPDTIRLLYVGHLCRDKGTAELIEAFGRLQSKYPKLRLDLVGECLPPFTEQELSRLLDHSKVRDKVNMRGVLIANEKARAFGRADLFVFPSVAPYESFGLVLVEAMSWKLPIVASNWRGNAEVLTSQAGAICFSLTSSLTEDLLLALEEAMQQSDRWHQWGTTNRLIFEDRYKEFTGNEWLVGPLLNLIGSK